MFALVRANPWLGMAAELTMLVVYMSLLRLVQWRGALSAEAARKLFHIGGGLSTLTFPWLFAVLWPPLVLAPITIGSLLALKHVRGLRGGLGNVLYGIERASLGEVYMPLSITLVWLLARGNPVLYGIPVLVLALADPAAALIGSRFGRLRYRLVSGQKSLEGSLAFALVAFASVQAPLLLFTGAGYGLSLLIALNVALLAMLAEAVAWHGLDNLFIPLLTFGVLRLCLGLHVPALAVQGVVMLALCVVILGWGRRHSVRRAHTAAAHATVAR
jgi:phytol kinase